MKKYHLLIGITVILLGLGNVYADSLPTNTITPSGVATPNLSNILIGMFDGTIGSSVNNYSGFMDSTLLYSPTSGGIADAVTLDPIIDGDFFENCKYDQLFMGTLIISENGVAQSGGFKYNVFNHVQFSFFQLNQDQDFEANGETNPILNAPYSNLNKFFNPHYPITGNIETYMKVSDGAGITITQRTAQYPGSTFENISELSGLSYHITDPKDNLANTIIKNYTITNNSDYTRTIYVTQRLDGAINTTWTEKGSGTDIGDGYKIHFFTTNNDGEFNDQAGYQEPISGIYNAGYFGYIYDESLGDTITGIGVRILGDNPVPASFKIVPYQPANVYIDGTEGRLVKYGISSVSDPLNIKSPYLRPYNPMEDTINEYNDFVDAENFDPNTTSNGNYAVGLTAGPFEEIEAGQSINITFAITAAFATTKDTFLKNLDTQLYDADASYYSGTGVSTTGGFAMQDIEPPAKPKFVAVYEKYDSISDTVTLNIEWQPQKFTEVETETGLLGQGFNLYCAPWTELEPITSSYKRISKDEVTHFVGALKNAPTSYELFTSTSYAISASIFNSNTLYEFALTANDEKWYNDVTELPQLKDNYFNESDPDIWEISFAPAGIDLKVKFAYKDNSNIFKLSWDSPVTREKDLKKYEIYRRLSTYELVQTVYLQGGVYKEVKNATAPFSIKMILDDNEYTVTSDDIQFNPNDALSEVMVNIPEFNNDHPLIIENFYLQEIVNTSPFTISESDTAPVNYVWSGYTDYYKDVYYDKSADTYYWEKTDNWGNIYYQASDGSVVKLLPTGYETIIEIYGYGYPESIIDYTKPQLAGSTQYFYWVKKYDFLSPDSADSNKIIVATNPLCPTDLVAVHTNQTVELTWNGVPDDIFRYYIYKCSTSAILESPTPLEENYIEKVGGITVSGTPTATYSFTDNYVDNYNDYYYFITAYNRTTDLESSRSNIASVRINFDYESDLKKAHNVPNPIIFGTKDAEKENNNIVFVGLTEEADIYIYTLRGNLVKKITHNASSPTAYGTGGEKWDLTNESGNPVATGLYFYVIKNPKNSDDIKKGKLAIVR
jgi:hypothetical protein